MRSTIAKTKRLADKGVGALNEERTDDRLKRDLGVARRSRGSEDRKVTEDRVLTDDVRLQMFQQQLYNDALPDLPKNDPDWHYIWLTTTNPRDTIHQRMRLGYELVKAEDVPGFGSSVTIKTGDYAGCIGVNEMVAARLPMSLYQGFMKIAHHDRPQEQEDILKQSLEELNEKAQRDGGRLVDGAERGEVNGMEDLRRSVPPPTHFD